VTAALAATAAARTEERLAMRIGELSKRTGVSVRSIRHYEQQGLVRASRRASGYREFEEGAVELVSRIQVLLRNGFTLDEIRSVAVDLDDSNLDAVCREVAALYHRKLAELDERIREVEQLQRRIRERLVAIGGA
jgi:DNA-binding transcriptional MerR regulator